MEFLHVSNLDSYMLYTPTGPLLLRSGSSFCTVLHEWHLMIPFEGITEKATETVPPSLTAIAANKQNNYKLIGLLHFCPAVAWYTAWSVNEILIKLRFCKIIYSNSFSQVYVCSSWTRLLKAWLSQFQREGSLQLCSEVLCLLFGLLFWIWIISNYTTYTQQEHFDTKKECLLWLNTFNPGS